MTVSKFEAITALGSISSSKLRQTTFNLNYFIDAYLSGNDRQEWFNNYFLLTTRAGVRLVYGTTFTAEYPDSIVSSQATFTPQTANSIVINFVADQTAGDIFILYRINTGGSIEQFINAARSGIADRELQLDAIVRELQELRSASEGTIQILPDAFRPRNISRATKLRPPASDSAVAIDSDGFKLVPFDHAAANTNAATQDSRLDALETDALINSDTTRNAQQDADIMTLKGQQTAQDRLILANTNKQSEIDLNTTRSTANAAKNVQQDGRLDKVESGFMQGAGPIPLVCAVKHNNELTNEPTPSGNAAANSPAFPTGFGIDFTTKMATGLTTPIDPDTIAVGEVPDNFFSNWMNSSSTFVSEYRARKTEFDLYVVYVHGDPVNDKGATGYGVPDIRPAFAEKADQDVVIVQSTGVPASIVMQAWVNSVEFAAINLVLNTYGLTFTNAGLVASTETGIVDPRHADQGGFVRGLAEIPTDQEKNRLVEFTLGVPSGTAFEPAVVYELRALESTLRTVDRLSPTELRQQRRSPYTDGTPVWRPIREANIRPIITSVAALPRIEIDVIGENIGTGVRGVDLLPINNIIRRFQQTRWHGDIFFIYGLTDSARGGFRNYKVSLVIDHTLYTQGNPRTFRIVRSKLVAVRADTFEGEGGLQTSRQGLRTEFDLNRFTNEFQLDPDIDARISAMDFAPGNVGIQMYLQVEPDNFDDGQVHFDGMFSVTTRDTDGVWTGAEFIFDQLADNVLLGDAAVFNAPVPHSIYIQVDAAAGGATPAAPAAPTGLIMQLDSAGQPTENNPAESLRTTGGDPLTSVMAGGVAFSAAPKAHVEGKFQFEYRGFARPKPSDKTESLPIVYSTGLQYTSEVDLPVKRFYYYELVADGDAIPVSRSVNFTLATQVDPNVNELPTPTATQRVVRYIKDVTSASQRADSANRAGSFTFEFPVVISAIDGQPGSSSQTPRDVPRLETADIVPAEGAVLVGNDNGRLVQGPGVGEAGKIEAGKLVRADSDGNISTRRASVVYPFNSTGLAITDESFDGEVEVPSDFKWFNAENHPLFDSFRIDISLTEDDSTSGRALLRAFFFACDWPPNSLAGSPSKRIDHTSLTDNSTSYIEIGARFVAGKLRVSATSANRQPTFDFVNYRVRVTQIIVASRESDQPDPAPPFSFSPQTFPVTGMPIEDLSAVGGILNTFFSVATGNNLPLAERLFRGGADRSFVVEVEGFDQRTRREDNLQLYLQAFDIYGESQYSSVDDLRLDRETFSADGDVTFRVTSGGQGTSTVARDGKRVELFITASPNTNANAADFPNRLVLSNIALDEGAFRFVTWGSPSGAGDITIAFSSSPQTAWVTYGFGDTHFETPQDNTNAVSPNTQANVEGVQALELNPNRWHFGNVFGSGGTVFFGTREHFRLPHELLIPHVYNNHIRNNATNNRIKIYFPWVDLQKLQSITLAAPGLPTATLWERTTDASRSDKQFFKLVEIAASAETRWIRMAMFESTMATGSGYVGTRMNFNLFGDS